MFYFVLCFMFYVLCLVYFLIIFLLCTVVGMRGKCNVGPLYVCTYIGLTIKPLWLSDSDSDFEKASSVMWVYTTFNAHNTLGCWCISAVATVGDRHTKAPFTCKPKRMRADDARKVQENKWSWQNSNINRVNGVQETHRITQGLRGLLL